jgi:hypothetical protein
MSEQKAANLGSFAKKLDILTSTDKEVRQLFMISLSGSGWSNVYTELYGRKPTKEMNARFDKLRTVKRISSSSADREPEEHSHDLKKALKHLKKARRVLESSELAAEKDAVAFFAEYPQIRDLRDLFLASNKSEKAKAQWTPLYATRAFIVAMHGSEYQILWSEHFDDKTSDTKRILNAFRKQHTQIDEAQFASLIGKYVH